MELMTGEKQIQVEFRQQHAQDTAADRWAMRKRRESLMIPGFPAVNGPCYYESKAGRRKSLRGKAEAVIIWSSVCWRDLE